jgi:hypothetical protein
MLNPPRQQLVTNGIIPHETIHTRSAEEYFLVPGSENQEEEKAYKITAPVTFFAISAQAFSNRLKSEDYWGKEG